MYTVSIFGSLAFGALPASYSAYVQADPGFAAAVNTRTRRNRGTVRDSLSGAVRTLTLQIVLQSSTNLTASQLTTIQRQVLGALDPTLGPRLLTAVNDAGGDTMTLTCDVIAAAADPNRLNVIVAQLQTSDPFWQSTSTSSQAASTGTTTTLSSTDVRVFPIIVVAPGGTSCRRYRVNVSDNSDRGLKDYFCRVVIGESMDGSERCVLFFRNRAVPFKPIAIDGTHHYLDFRVDVPAAGTVSLDYYIGAALPGNPSTWGTINRLEYGQINGGDTRQSTTALYWNSLALSAAPAASGQVWTPQKVGQSRNGSATGLTAEGSSAVFGVVSDGTLLNDVDSMSVVLGTGCTGMAGLTGALAMDQAPATEVQRITLTPQPFPGATPPTGGTFALQNSSGKTGPLGPIWLTAVNLATALGTLPNIGSASNVSVTLVNAGGSATPLVFDVTYAGKLAFAEVEVFQIVDNSLVDSNPLPIAATVERITKGAPKSVRAFVRGRAPGSPIWAEFWSADSPGSYSTDCATLIGGVAAVQLAVGIEPVVAGAEGTLTLTPGAAWWVALSGGPTITVDAAVTAYALNGTLTNDGGYTLTFDWLLIDADNFNIDCDAQTMVPTTAGKPWYGSVYPTDPDLWWPLKPGANVWASSLSSSSVTFALFWHNRYAL